MSTTKVTSILFSLLLLGLVACGRDATPVSDGILDEPEGAAPAGELAFRDTEDPIDAALRVPLRFAVDPAPAATPQRGENAPPDPAAADPTGLTTFPFAPSASLPTIEAAFLVCDGDALTPWLRVSSPTGLSMLNRKVAIRLDDGGQSLLFVAGDESPPQQLSPIEAWNRFPGDPDPELVGQVCAGDAWPMTVEVTDGAGVELKAALRVAVKDSAYESEAAARPANDAQILLLPWIDPGSGLALVSAELRCAGVDGLIPRVKVLSASLDLTGVEQRVSFWGPRGPLGPRHSAVAELRAGRAQSFTSWQAPGSPVDGEADYEGICAGDTWRIHVTLSNGGGQVLEGLVDAVVTTIGAADPTLPRDQPVAEPDRSPIGSSVTSGVPAGDQRPPDPGAWDELVFARYERIDSPLLSISEFNTMATGGCDGFVSEEAIREVLNISAQGRDELLDLIESDCGLMILNPGAEETLYEGTWTEMIIARYGAIPVPWRTLDEFAGVASNACLEGLNEIQILVDPDFNTGEKQQLMGIMNNDCQL